MKTKTAPNLLVRITHLIRLLRAVDEFTRDDVIVATGLSRETVLNLLRVMHGSGHIRVCDWRLDTAGRPNVRVYEFGDGPDAAKPRPRTDTERHRVMRERRRHAGLMVAQQALQSWGARA